MFIGLNEIVTIVLNHFIEKIAFFLIAFKALKISISLTHLTQAKKNVFFKKC